MYNEFNNEYVSVLFIILMFFHLDMTNMIQEVGFRTEMCKSSIAMFERLHTENAGKQLAHGIGFHRYLKVICFVEI